MEQLKFDSELEIYIHNNQVIIFEYYSYNMIDKVIEELEKTYGIVMSQKNRSMCG